MSQIALSAGMRTNLTSLERTSNLLAVTQERLATGRKVNSAIDNPTNFFAAANLNDRAVKLEARLDGMGQAISTLQTADAAITSMRGIVSAMKGVVDEALAASDSTDRVTLGRQYNELLVQLNDFASDSEYKGVNLLVSGQSDATSGGNEVLTVQFSADYNDSTLDIKGVNIRGASGMGVNTSGEITIASNMSGASTTFAVSFNEESEATGSAIGLRAADIDGTLTVTDGTGHELTWVDDATYKTTLESVIGEIEAFDQALVNTARNISQNVNIVSIRQEFTSNAIDIHESGADKLTLADLNEEGANLLALQTGQSLATQSLSLASQANQSVLQLLG